MKPIFVSIPASNYVEKARWALQLVGIAYTEERHTPLFHRLSTRPKGGQTVPLLFFPDTKKALTDSKDIIDLCAKEDPSLYPNAETKALEVVYDDELGPYTRRLSYFFLFMNWSMSGRILVSPADSLIERILGWLCLPIIRLVITKFMGINETGAYRSMDKIEHVAREAEEKLGDSPVGTQFLCGEIFSAADIAFCAHMSLLLGPPEHAYLVPLTHHASDHPLRSRVEKFKQSKAAAFVYWCYKHKRPPMIPHKQTAKL